MYGNDVDVEHIEFARKVCFVKCAENTVSGVIDEDIDILAARFAVKTQTFLDVYKRQILYSTV